MPAISHKSILQQLKKLGDEKVAASARRFTKTGKGEYGEGDQFIGIRVPVIRQLAKEFQTITLRDVDALLHSPFHEARMLALLIMVRRYTSSKDPRGQQHLYEMYINNTEHINNWDLVDCSSYKLIGPHLFDRDRSPLYKLARSKLLWDRRISIITTLYFIKRDDYDDTLAIAEILLKDPDDLMHKATGWVLREVGNRDRAAEDAFLKKHGKVMPRTMLRYAIEKLPESHRKAYLKGAK